MSEKLERLGNYILLEKINAGGMAEVYLSKSIGANGVNKFLAIKRILPQFADNREFLEMFKEEAKIAVNLSHNNVVSIIDFKASKNQLYLVMEYLQGQNLRQVLQQKKKKGLSLSLDYIVYLIREVSAGLDYAHRCVDKATGKPLNIIHRDMSPQNIMISYDGEIKIVDFGIAKAEATGESTRIGTLKGKFSYMSPEQAEGLVIDQSSDIFSLGIILWELIADDRLFIANNEMNILKRIKECDVPDLRRVNPSVPVELERIVKKALLKDKSQRYQTAADLQKDLTRFLNKEYPDFTPSDFSTFMKFLFENEYVLAQERIVNYAKLDFGSLGELNETHESTMNSSMILKAPPTPPPVHSHANNIKPPAPPLDAATIVHNEGQNTRRAKEVEDEFESSAQINRNPNLPNKDEENLLNLPEVTGQTNLTGLTNATGLKRSRLKKISSPNSYSGTKSGVTGSGIRYKTPASPPITELAKALFIFFIVFGVFGSVYFLAPKKIKTQISDRFQAISLYAQSKLHWNDEAPPLDNTPKTNTPAEGETSFASNTTVTILIKSNPGRARIFINGNDQGYTTPATVPVPMNKPFSLTLLADGYHQYTTRVTALKNGQEVTADLAQIKFGYLNINVINAGVDTLISINGVELKDRPPIMKYPVPSGQPVVVRALHPFSGTSAETSVIVGADEKKTVDLILTVPSKSKNEGRK